MIGRIIGLIISIALIVMGASGEFVLKGTESSTALIIAGVVFLIIDIYGIFRASSGDDDSSANEE